MLLVIALFLQRVILSCCMQLTPSYVKLVIVILSLAGMSFVLDSWESILSAMFHQSGERSSQFFDDEVCEDNHCCHMSSSEACNLTSMPLDVNTLVFPGGNTRCITSYYGSFSFQVVPGDKDKVLYYFQGGGACNTELTTDLMECRQRAQPETQFDDKNFHAAVDPTSEKFSKYTIIAALYCSGDFFTGNRQRDYYDAYGEKIVNRGLVNAQAMLDWTVQQQMQGSLASSLSELILSGASAGSIGVQMWTDRILSNLEYDYAAVIPDSHMIVFPDNAFTDSVVENAKLCDTGLFSGDLQEKCLKGKMKVTDVILDFASKHPTVPFAYLQSKLDENQSGQFTRTGYSLEEWYKSMNEMLQLYMENAPNILVYLVDGDNHVFLAHEEYFTADAAGYNDKGENYGGLTLKEWVEQFPLQPGQTAQSVCVGSVKDSVHRHRRHLISTTTATTTAAAVGASNMTTALQNSTDSFRNSVSTSRSSGLTMGSLIDRGLRGRGTSFSSSKSQVGTAEPTDSRHRDPRMLSNDDLSYCLQIVLDSAYTQQ